MLTLLIALQIAVPPVDTPVCQVIPRSSKIEASTDLYAGCGKIAVPLGSGETYRSSYNASLKSLVVVSASGGEQRVQVITQMADGSPLVNDVTRDLTRLSGRYAEAGLEGEVDLTTFPVDGSVSVPSRPVPTNLPQGLDMIEASRAAARPAGPAVPARFDLASVVDALTTASVGIQAAEPSTEAVASRGQR